MAEQRTTSASGAPVAGDERSLTVGPNGPTALQDAYVLEAEPGAKAAQTLRHQGFEGRLVLVGTEHERRTSVRRCRRTTCAATRALLPSIRSKGAHHE